ncbi:RND transporter [Stieleria varia]|uniref:RND transporter n=1 Tax=Stieleria varia TaxID=2528005 RepID=A0A5C6AZF4_9BACT|nr:RND transporter [Stieleria varia]TWU05080.1 hypothetical protein Pla52n_31260 [Stieleria varia]
MRLFFSMMLAALVSVGITGCGEKTQEVVHEHAEGDHAEGEHAADKHAEGEHASHDHSGWWCNEHGVPEEECALCKTSLIADFKAKGDWCDEHNRPDSQCFICNPDNFSKFASRYEAKFGEQPPKPTE